MSLILEALRKSEAERRRGEAPDLFQPDVVARTTASPSPRPWLWAAPVLLLLPLLYWWPRAPDRGSNVVAGPVQDLVAAAWGDAAGPRVAMGVAAGFVALSALALTKVDPRRREEEEQSMPVPGLAA